MSNTLRTVVLLGILALGGCASLSRNECAAGDWYGIGQRDGANGYPEERFADHAAACVKHGVTPDRAQWLDGRERGLERFCTARHAFDVGASNSSYAGVCAGPAEDDFLHGYRLGKALAEARGRRDRWDHEIHRLRHLLEEDRQDDKRDQRDDHPRLSNAERVEIGFQLGVAMMRRDEADRDVQDINQLSARL
jgi:hypothetical protein